MRTSASRPDFLKHSTEKLLEHLKYSGNFKWIIHEDCLNKERSNECMKYIEECGVYDIVKQDNPPISQGYSLGWLLGKVKSKYVLNFEDDFEPTKDIDIDMLIKLMDGHLEINQICFHKRNIMAQKPGFKKKQVVVDGIPLVVCPHWNFIPSIFRLSYLKPKWQNFTIDCHWKINEVLKGGKKMRDADWVMNNTGTYYLGSIKNKKMLKKNGGTLTQEEYDKLDNGWYSKHIGANDGSVRLGKYGK